MDHARRAKAVLVVAKLDRPRCEDVRLGVQERRLIAPHLHVAGAERCGYYPPWWQGRRFSGPVRCWAAGKTNETTRDVPQLTLLGPVVYEGDRKTVAGTGLIRGEFLEPPFWKQGVANLVDTVKVQHVNGGLSLLGFKAYKQGRGSSSWVRRCACSPTRSPMRKSRALTTTP